MFDQDGVQEDADSPGAYPEKDQKMIHFRATTNAGQDKWYLVKLTWKTYHEPLSKNEK